MPNKFIQIKSNLTSPPQCQNGMCFTIQIEPNLSQTKLARPILIKPLMFISLFVFPFSLDNFESAGWRQPTFWIPLLSNIYILYQKKLS